jgi:hypothetical protein
MTFTWNAQPLTLSVSPSSGGSATGTAQSFTVAVTDPFENSQMSQTTYLYFGGTAPAGLCAVQYGPGSFLLNTNSGAFTSTLQNSQCSVSLVSASVSGTTASLTVSVTFTPAFVGSRAVWQWQSTAIAIRRHGRSMARGPCLTELLPRQPSLPRPASITPTNR